MGLKWNLRFQKNVLKGYSQSVISTELIYIYKKKKNKNQDVQ